MSLRAPGIQHVNLAVRDLERSQHFYVGALGFERVFSKGTTVWLQAGDSLLGLSEGEPVDTGFNHFGFQVDRAELVDAWASQLVDRDVKLERGPYDRSDGRSVYFRDPDGYLFEIFYIDPAILSVPPSQS